MKLIDDIVKACRVPAAQLAKDAGLNEATVYSWLTGRREPQPESLRQLADGLETRAAIILEEAKKLRRAASG